MKPSRFKHFGITSLYVQFEPTRTDCGNIKTLAIQTPSKQLTGRIAKYIIQAKRLLDHSAVFRYQ